MRVGICAGEGRLDEVIERCRRLGVDAICLSASTVKGYREKGYPNLEALRAIKDRLGKAGIDVPTISLGLWPSQEVLSGRVRSEDELQKLYMTLEVIGKAGIETALIYPALDRPMSRVVEEAYWRSIQRTYEVLLDAAERYHVKLANHAFYHPWKVIRNVETLCRLLVEAPSPYNGVTYCQGLYLIGDDPYEAVVLFGDKIFLAHARNLRKLGHAPYFEEVFLDEGDVDIPKTIRLLEAVGYDGMIYPEHLGAAGAGEDLQAKAVSYLKKLVGV